MFTSTKNKTLTLYHYFFRKPHKNFKKALLNANFLTENRSFYQKKLFVFVIFSPSKRKK